MDSLLLFLLHRSPLAMGHVLIRKFIALMAMFLTLDLVCSSSKCSTSEYQTKDGCCRKPEPGFYVIRNCTRQISMLAQKCSNCTGPGMEIVANCTRFSDTDCRRVDLKPVTDPNSTSPPPVNILIPATVVLLLTVLIPLFGGFCYCLHKCRKTAEFLKVPSQV
ncbi:hypothetical protein COCON_G00180010 [Conger conger]|uniref:TNFR-Cys domain-containing protein n=1 Tax=Conger conger TaxID=82655 RepID=A0A9Q1HT06_CONCO|nr:hypothetical protein COCON_G00180010 [Conger conger]